MQLFTLIRGGCISFSLSLIVFEISACATSAQNKNLSVLDYLYLQNKSHCYQIQFIRSKISSFLKTVHKNMDNL